METTTNYSTDHIQSIDNIEKSRAGELHTVLNQVEEKLSSIRSRSRKCIASLEETLKHYENFTGKIPKGTVEEVRGLLAAQQAIHRPLERISQTISQILFQLGETDNSSNATHGKQRKSPEHYRKEMMEQQARFVSAAVSEEAARPLLEKV